MEIVAAEATNLFTGTEAAPRQVVRLVLRGSDASAGQPGRVRIEGARVRTDDALTVGPLRPGETARVEVGITVDEGVAAGEELTPRSSWRAAAGPGPRSGSSSPSPAGGCS